MKTNFLLFCAFSLFAANSLYAVASINSPGHISHSTSRIGAGTPAMSVSAPAIKWSTSLTWRERLGVFFLKRQLRREEKRHGAAQTVGKDNTLAIISLISGVATYPVLIIAAAAASLGTLIISFICGVAAIVLGILALVQISQDREKYGGTGMAIIGLVLGAVLAGVGGFILLLIAAFSAH